MLDEAVPPELNLPSLIADKAAQFAWQLRAVPGVVEAAPPALPPHTPGLVWRNQIFSAPAFRRAHLEIFSVPGQFAVLHLCIFPHLDDPSSIFGFDMLGGTQQATGLFLDFSPVLSTAPSPALGQMLDGARRAACGTPRALPEWGGIFSTDFLAVRPKDATALHAGLTAAAEALAVYLAHIGGRARGPLDAIIAGQAAYVAGQRRNPHTARMLARHVGDAAARLFMEEVLFPPPQDPPKLLERAA